jgi:hypothetical protein
MGHPISPHPTRILIDALDREFSFLHEKALHFLQVIPPDLLYSKQSESREWSEPGESLLRGAAIVEQTCGGLLSNLWDDPFEWTLAETLNSVVRISEYLEEVESIRVKTFARFESDNELMKDIAVPSGELLPIVSVLIDTLVRAAEQQGRVAVAVKMLSGASAAGVII